MFIPDEYDDETVRILGIDPGTDKLGVAIVDVNIITREAILVFANTYHASSVEKGKDWESTIRGARDVRLRHLSCELTELFNTVNPLLIGAESPFLQRSRVSAFEALVECYMMLRETVWNYNTSICLQRIDPITAKSAVGVSHIGTDKDDVHKAVIATYSGKHLPAVKIEELDEHSSDAVTVAHYIYRRYILNDITPHVKRKKSKCKVKVSSGKRRRRRKRKLK